MIRSLVLPRLNKFGFRTEQLWLLIILLMITVVVSLTAIYPNDFWWYLKVGQMIYETGSVPTTNIFAWSVPVDQPYTYGSWLAAYILYYIYKLGGIPLIIFSNTILLVSAVGLAGLFVARITRSWRIAAFTTFLCSGMVASNVVVRPQSFSWLPFVLFLILLYLFSHREIKGWFLLLCPILMVFWVNIHGSFILGFVLIGIFFIGELIRFLYKIEPRLNCKEIGMIAGTGILCCFSILLNPKSIGIIDYAYSLITDSSVTSLLTEWQPPTLHSFSGAFFFFTITVFFSVFAYSKYRPTPTEIIIVLAFFWLAITSTRNIIWFALAAMPALGKAILYILEGRQWMAVGQKNLYNMLFVIVLSIPAVIAQPWFVGKIVWPEGYMDHIRQSSPYGPLIYKYTPIEAAEYLRTHPGGKLFNDMGFGSYLIWAIPEQSVFVDTRVELYPSQVWLDYQRIILGIRPLELLDQYGADRVLLSKENLEHSDLVKILEASPAWKLQYEDPYAQLWEKQ